jgi:hypothetical protein
MTPFARIGDVVIGQLRVVSPGGDSLSARLRASSLLEAARLEPRALPPSAVVVIRKLADPLPGSLSIRGAGLRPPPDWERAVSDALDRLIRRAARPARGSVPADAEAVVFADPSEMLACLAADWRDGLVVVRWWWRGLLRQTDAARAVLNAWLAAPESVPAALRLLADQGRAVAFAAALDQADARALLDAITLRFGLPDVREALALLDAPLPDSRAPVAMNPPGDRAIPSPWSDRAPEADSAGPGLPARLLLGIGLTLARAPAEVRAPSFARALRRRLATTTPPEPQDRPPSDLAPSTDSTEGPITDDRSISQPPRSPDRPPEDVALAPSAGTIEPAEEEPATDALRARGSEESERDRPTTAPAPSETEPAPAVPAVEEEVIPGPSKATAPADDSTAPADAGPLVVPVETRFGGIFFLINLGQFLGLYGDFSTPRAAEIALGLWDFVALVGLRLVGESIRDDPVWPLLASLAGREESEPPGRDFAPEDDWRLPPEWLSAFPEPDAWSWDTRGGRLRVRHPSGFLVLDVDAQEDQLRKEMQAYPAATTRREAIPIGEAADSPAGRWLDWFTPYARARLARAMGVEQVEEVGEVLCGATARIFVSATRLDVMMSMEEHPVAIRLAGLDRDPGWVPAAGRSVHYHFD